MNAYDQMRQAVAEAKTTLSAADSVATELAELLSGRLRKVNSNFTLRKLKRELSDYDSKTGCWKK